MQSPTPVYIHTRLCVHRAGGSALITSTAARRCLINFRQLALTSRAFGHRTRKKPLGVLNQHYNVSYQVQYARSSSSSCCLNSTARTAASSSEWSTYNKQQWLVPIPSPTPPYRIQKRSLKQSSKQHQPTR